MTNGDRVDPDAVRALIDAQFPHLSPSRVTYLGEGCDSAAFEVNGNWVFRFPKRADVEHQLLTEMRFLPHLRERSPVALPAYAFHGRPSAAFPRQFGGYPKLVGVPAILLEPGAMPLRAVAPVLGRFLSIVHAFPIDDAADLGVPDQGTEALLEEIRADALDDFGLVRQEAPDAPLDCWRAYLESGLDPRAARAGTPCLVHNDLAAEHILCDPIAGSVTGVIDWSDVAIGDPAADLAGMFHWGGEELASAVLSHYEGNGDDALCARARFMAACRGVADVAFGLGTCRREYVAAGLRALQLCAGGS